MKSKCFAGVVMVLTFVLSARADIYQFNVSLDGIQEVPPNASPGTGTAIAILDDVTGSINITGTFSGLTAAADNAHLHGFAPPGTAAGVLFGLTFTPSTSGIVTGSGSVSLANVPNVLNGLTYINIHSDNFPGGEIRGQLSNPVAIPEPGTFAMAGLGGLALLLVRRRRR